MNRPRPLRPATEDDRLRALRSYAILDTPPESEYDAIVELAATACNTPIAMVSFVDADRVWVKAGYGFDASESSRDDAFCAHAILSTEIFEIEDTHDDFRVAENPFVIGEPFVRFYAGVPLISKSGHALGVLCVVDHVPRRLSATERHALESFGKHIVSLLELRRREERLRDLVEGSRDVIFEASASGRFRFINSAVEPLLGFHPDALIGQHFTALVHPDWHESVIRHYVEQRENRVASTYLEFPCLSRDGAEIWFGQHARAVIRDGEVVAFHAISRDITMLREAERAKREAEKRFEAFMDNSPAVAFIKDDQGRFVFLNDTLARFLGKPSAEVIGTHGSELVSPETYRMISSSDEIVLRHSQNMRVVESFPAPDGTERHWLMHKFPLPGPDQSVFLGAFGVDVTDRITLEIDLADARDAAIASARQKSEFLAMMSHEIRTPMNGVLGMLGVLLDSDLTEDQRDLADTAKVSAESLLTLLNDILDFSKIEAGKLDFEMSDFDVRVTVDSVLDLLGDSARAKSLDVHCDFNASVPQRMRGDAGRLRQVLLNLIANAVKFTAAGSVSVCVTCESDGVLRFAITDTGIGIPVEAQKRLFAPFVQADSSTTRRFGGTGLGLAISHRLVEMMNGEIGVNSIHGKGSTFWFTARFENAQETPMTSIETGAPRPVVTSRPAAAVATTPRTRRGRILVAEDNAVNQKVALRLLEKLGYRADVVANGLEAIDALHRVPYDLVLMDCHMPEMDGFAATRLIRVRETRRMPIIALTASVMAEDRERCMQSGMDDVLTKPVRETDLASVLDKWMPEEEEPAVDPTAFAGLVELSDGDNAFLSDLIETYVAESRLQVVAIMQALQAGSANAVGRAVHALSGSSRSVGALKLGRICSDIEARAFNAAPIGELTSLIPALRQAHMAACAVLEREKPRKAM